MSAAITEPDPAAGAIAGLAETGCNGTSRTGEYPSADASCCPRPGRPGWVAVARYRSPVMAQGRPPALGGRAAGTVAGGTNCCEVPRPSGWGESGSRWNSGTGPPR